MKLTHILLQLLLEKKEDRCKRIADRKYDKPSAYKSGAIVRCRQGKIWKDLKEIGDANISPYTPELIYSEGEIYKPDGYVEYEFITDADTNYGVQIFNKQGYLYIDFVANGLYSLTGEKEPFKIMSTVTSIIKSILDKDIKNKIKGIQYSMALEKGVDRSKLYKAFILKQKPDTIFKEKDGLVIATFLKTKVNEVKKETLRTWFKRKGTPGKEGGWVDCNTCRDGKCKSCGRKEGEKRAKYPSCRPTPAQCKTKGKGKKWGKTK